MKKAKKVDQQLLRRMIKEVEGNGPLQNQTELYEKVAERYNEIIKDIRLGANAAGTVVDFPNITQSVVLLRIKEWKIPIVTKPGKRGRPVGHKNTKVNRTTRAEKFAGDPLICKSLGEIEKDLVDKPKWAEKIAEGSLIYAVKAHCFACSGYSVPEMKQCKLLSCSLFPFLKRISDED